MDNNLTQKIDSLMDTIIELKGLIDIQSKALGARCSESPRRIGVLTDVLGQKADNALNLCDEIETEIYNTDKYSTRRLSNNS